MKPQRSRNKAQKCLLDQKQNTLFPIQFFQKNNAQDDQWNTEHGSIDGRNKFQKANSYLIIHRNILTKRFSK
uniref:Uncharacterized protein n=1 Tax=Rhizophora mucronata TaxID=61149 RepID=A0A2P2IZX3_RHIMU